MCIGLETPVTEPLLQPYAAPFIVDFTCIDRRCILVGSTRQTEGRIIILEVAQWRPYGGGNNRILLKSEEKAWGRDTWMLGRGSLQWDFLIGGSCFKVEKCTCPDCDVRPDRPQDRR